MNANAQEKQTAAVRIRAANHDDAAALARLCIQLGYDADADQLRRRLTQIDQDPNHAIFVAQQEGGEIVGFVDLDCRCLAIKDASVEVCGLVIDQSVRGRGYGQALMQKAEAWAQAIGASAISLRSNVIRKEAHAFYQRCGYEIYKQQLAFQKRLVCKSDID